MKNDVKNVKNAEKTQKNNQNDVINRDVSENKYLKKDLHETKKEKKGLKSAVVGLSVAVAILGVTTTALGVAYGITESQANAYGTQLENVYQKSYYELVDSANNADTDMSKLLNSNSSTYQKKLLTEISSTAKSMQSNIALLPLTGEDILESVRFVNQLAGYTSTLEEKVSEGEDLTSDDLATLEELHMALMSMKENLNRISMNMRNGYSILSASNEMNGDLNTFSIDFSQIKSSDVDYPTMIYDGPFSDSVVNKKIVGLSGTELGREEVETMVKEVFKDLSKCQYTGETNGNFDTYNFKVETSDMQNLFVQATKIGGHILTVSGQNESDAKTVDMKAGEKIALEFAKNNGVKNAEVVWQEELNNQAYFNIAPKQDGVILYPDLVKVKVDLEYGNVIGYDAISYWTNHKTRDLASAGDVSVSIPSGFTVKTKRLGLAPLDYNREVLCYEYQCEKDGITYYFYFNAQTGNEENILKVLQTQDSSKLM